MIPLWVLNVSVNKMMLLSASDSTPVWKCALVSECLNADWAICFSVQLNDWTRDHFSSVQACGVECPRPPQITEHNRNICTLKTWTQLYWCKASTCVYTYTHVCSYVRLINHINLPFCLKIPYKKSNKLKYFSWYNMMVKSNILDYK